MSIQTLTSKLPPKVELLDPVIREHCSEYLGFGSKLSGFFTIDITLESGKLLGIEQYFHFIFMCWRDSSVV